MEYIAIMRRSDLAPLPYNTTCVVRPHGGSWLLAAPTSGRYYHVIRRSDVELLGEAEYCSEGLHWRLKSHRANN
jgi:hypothetical protein